MTICSFRCPYTEAIYEGKNPRKFRNIESVAQRKLHRLDAAVELRDLKSPPRNGLEALKDDRVGQHSIRINDQWCICFFWTDAGPEDVAIMDYHQGIENGNK